MYGFGIKINFHYWYTVTYTLVKDCLQAYYAVQYTTFLHPSNIALRLMLFLSSKLKRMAVSLANYAI